MGLHEQFKISHLDTQQRDNYYQAFINFMSNETVRDAMIPYISDSIINLDIKANDAKRV